VVTEVLEKGGDVSGDELGCLDRSEVAAARHSSKAADVIEAFSAFAWCLAFRHERTRERGDSRRNTDAIVPAQSPLALPASGVGGRTGGDRETDIAYRPPGT